MRLDGMRARGLVLLALGATLGVTAGCNLLDVTNPGAITEDNLKGDSQTVTFMMNGVQGEFRREYAWLAAHGAMFTDEAIQGHPWSPWNVYDARAIPPESPAYDGLSYQLLQRARGTADVLIPKMEAALGSNADASLELAKAYAYAGYSYIMLADYMCEAPVNLSRAYSSAELYAMAIERLQRSLDIASGGAAAKAGAAEVANLARVGLARSWLDLDDQTKAVEFATPVPAGFAMWVRYKADPSDWQVYNFFQWFAGYRYAGELDLALETPYLRGVKDARIPTDEAASRRLADGLRDGYLPYQPSSFSEHTPSGTALFGEATGIRFASGLEAQYILAEAGAMTAAQLRTFVNARRAVGGLGDFGGTDAQLFDEVLEQRSRDFFMDGHRMGDLRRYKALYDKDFWPTGQMPGLSVNYGTQECWPIAASERNSNPNLQ